MEFRAEAQYMRVSPQKARLVLDLIKGRRVEEALDTLLYARQGIAPQLYKLLRSAIANAEHNHQVQNLDDLRVIKAVADGGPSMKRVSPRAMGRAYFVKHRTSHLTIELSDETAAPRTAAPRGGKG